MENGKIKRWFAVASFSVLTVIAIVLVSCGGDDDPKEKAATADFTFVVSQDGSGSVAFTNTSKNGKTYSWKFDECSATSTAESPMHVYLSSGTYSVELTATGDEGTAPSVITKDVVVEVDEEAVANLLEGGSFRGSDESKWTIVGTGANLLPKVEIGYTCDGPEGGSGGGLRVSDPDDLETGKTVEMVMYRSIALQADKTYSISALIKHGPLTATNVSDGGPKEAFISIEISDAAPSGTGGWKTSTGADTKVLLHRYCVCWMGAEMPAGNNGNWVNAYTAGWIQYWTGDKDVLDFTVPTSGTYYVGFKAGLGTAAGATFSSDGFVVDNVVISEK
jgi:PKD repeat protein